MKQKITVENIKGLDREKFYIIQIDKNEVSQVDAFELSKILTTRHIHHVIAPFEVKFAEKLEDKSEK